MPGGTLLEHPRGPDLPDAGGAGVAVGAVADQGVEQVLPVGLLLGDLADA